MRTNRCAGGERGWNVAVVGATGLVGRKMLHVLAERSFPVLEVRALASKKSAGSTLPFAGRDLIVEELTAGSFGGIDIALFSAGAAVSREFAPAAVGAGALVIDNSSAFRMDPGVPLAVPEVNPAVIPGGRGIIANPNCSTIQLVVVLKPLHDRWKIRRVVVSTYQSVTGAGQKAVDQLEGELRNEGGVAMKFPHRIAFNALPQVDVFEEGGSTREELKMLNETRKIMGEPDLNLTATCVRIPATGGHSESVNVEFAMPFELDDVRTLLRDAPGITLQDDPGRSIYPMPVSSDDRDDVFVGRLRRDTTVPNGLNLWVVSDNLRKGAATNAVQIAECWIRHETISSSLIKDRP
ncbi:MAG TPA: aspartate-semialdehyde dehydrogenase [Bacteroidota bacterium]|nr:aspartate-semialdehyde dehydrogenase [Bacteroidota bacterium]